MMAGLARMTAALDVVKADLLTLDGDMATAEKQMIAELVLRKMPIVPESPKLLAL